MSNTVTQSRPAVRPPLRSGVLAVLVASVVGVLLCGVVAWLARTAGASASFLPLTLPVFAPFVVVGTTAGVLGWSIIRRRAGDPRRVLARLVPTMFVLSLIPDVVAGVTRFLPGTSWVGVAGLATMHVVVTLSVVAASQWRLPVEPQPHDTSRRRARENA